MLILFAKDNSGATRPPAGPSCQRKGLQDKGAWYVSLCLIRLPSSEKVCLKRRMFFVWAEYPRFNAGTDFQLQRITVSQRPESFSFAKECRAATLYSASVCEGKPCISAPGPPAGLQAAGPVDASRRNSLPPLSAAATVQAPPPVQCVRRRRAVVVLGR